MLALGGRLLVPVGLLAFAIAYYFSVRALPPEASLLPELMLAVFAILLLIDVVDQVREWSRSEHRSLRDEIAHAGGTFRDEGLSRTALIVGLTFVWLFGGVRHLGFYESTAIFIPAGLYLLGERRPWLIAALTFGAIATCYAAFTIGLELRLPEGLLF